MNKGIIIGAIVAGVIGFVCVTSYVGAYNRGNTSEARIHAMYQNNENIFAQYGQKVAEAVGVTTIAKDQMTELLTASLEARYGSDGANSTFLAVTEAFPGLDQGVYTQIQRIIEGGRNDFALAQTQLTDAKRVYVTELGSFWGGTWMSMAGYPSINVGYPLGTQDDYPVISTTRAAATFESGVECGNALSAAQGTDGCATGN